MKKKKKIVVTIDPGAVMIKNLPPLIVTVSINPEDYKIRPLMPLSKQ